MPLHLLRVAILAALAPLVAFGQDHDHGEPHEASHAHGDVDAADEFPEHLAAGAGLRALHGWTRATRSSKALVFVELSNISDGVVRLTGAESPIASKAELVGFQLVDGAQTWEAIGPIDLEANASVTLAPFGCAFRHIRSPVPTASDQLFRGIRSPRAVAAERGLVMSSRAVSVNRFGGGAVGAARGAKRAP